LRAKIIVLWTAALATALSCVWWLYSETVLPPLLPPSPERNRTVARSPDLQRLNYKIDTITGTGVIGIVNEESFAWNDVHVDVGEGDRLFQCPVLPTVGSGHTVVIQSRLCRSADGRLPSYVCFVRIVAKQGQVATGIEPCTTVQ
jgi:hypothetical protein